ncbi:carbohydrate sulfotransferase 10-like [Aulostomus maculatus]
MKVGEMRYLWLLLGTCGWVLLILTLATKYVDLRAINDYGRMIHNHHWVVSSMRQISLSSSESALRLSLDPSTVERWGTLVERRNQLISTVCKDSQIRNLTHVAIKKSVLDRIYVSDKNKILYCQIPKLANTQWKKILMVLNGAYPDVKKIPDKIANDQKKNGLIRLSSFSSQDITTRLHTYFKFFIVRNPFERLMASFNDKFVKNPKFEPWYRHDIAPAPLAKTLNSKLDNAIANAGLQFQHFARYLGDVGNRKRLDQQFGDHIVDWMTYAELCAPCEINYNVVGHYETLQKDAPYILRAAGISKLVSFPAIHPAITRFNKTRMQDLFSGVRKEDIRNLYARFQGDFRLFAYPRPDFLMMSDDQA